MYFCSHMGQSLSLHLRLAAIGKLGEGAADDRAYWRAVFEGVPYKKIAGSVGNLPFVLEAAFVVDAEADDTTADEERLQVTCGINWTPALPGTIPFPELNLLLSEQRIERQDPVTLVVHLACPLVRSTDRGKSRYDLPDGINEALAKCVRSVSKRWKKAKLHQERVSQQERRRMREGDKAGKLSLKDAAWQVMEQAYMVVSDNNQLPANARQIMYVARPLIMALTGGKFWKHSSSYTQGALPDFVAANPELTKDWDVVFDARGHFAEPHTNRRIGLGTVEVREYIGGWQDQIDGELHDIALSMACPTYGPANRYRYALFVEKEGFDALLERARIEERYDLALMSTKGLSVTAARQLVEELSRRGVTILVLHDFDKWGLSILHTIRTNTRRFHFQDRPNVIDLGLRLEDVRGLEAEEVTFPAKLKKDPRICLKAYGATKEERRFLVDPNGPPWKGKRVELNALTSRQFIDFLEQKLSEHGVAKVIPNPENLALAYRLAYQKTAVQKAINELVKEAALQKVSIPPDLATRVEGLLQEDSSLPWDEALVQIAQEEFGQEG
jgi:hypothetical protein